MFVVYLFINLLSAVFISADVALSHNEPTRVFDQVHENDEEQASVDFLRQERDQFMTSKHVFYWLYTRDEPKGQLLNRSDPNMMRSTKFNIKNPIKVIVHGWLGNIQEKQGFCSITVQSYLKIGEHNVICVDWTQYSTDLSYAMATLRAKRIGKDVSKFLKRITDDLTEGVENIHLIGHSLGAHIVGFTGKKLAGWIPRITALDPAKPFYKNSGPKDRIDRNDAKFVDVMHTCGGNLGLLESLGHIDFFPNGGKSQPGCGKIVSGWCSHLQSYRYFAHSIWAKEDYVAVRCSSWKDYEAKNCGKHVKSTYMGEHVDKIQTGDYYLRAPNKTHSNSSGR